MKYEIIKEAPLFKVGDIIEICNNSLYDDLIILQGGKVIKTSESIFKLLVAEGWIKEVKSREIWINDYDGILGETHYESKEKAKNSMMLTKCNVFIQQIKFIESEK